MGTLAAFATYAVGFLARPLGGLVLGRLGDRVGRRSMLVLTLVSMGVSITAIGLLPTYAQVGMLAPILLVLMRLVQGFGRRVRREPPAPAQLRHRGVGTRMARTVSRTCCPCLASPTSPRHWASGAHSDCGP